ncbi:MAG: SRPBCC family protein [Sphingomicrobium sp.]
MNQHATLDSYGVLTGPDTLKIERLLPGPIERVWAFLTESELRRQWFAAGEMDLTVGAPFELVWRNDELTDPPGERPPGMGGEHSMQSQITELDPPHKLGFSWGATGSVTFELKEQGDEVRLTVIHRRVADRSALRNFSAGWHAHLAILAARIAGTAPAPFWDQWAEIKAEYDQRLAD